MAIIANIPISHFSENTRNSSLIFSSPIPLSTAPRQAIHFHSPIARNNQKKSLYWKTFATPEEVLPSDPTPLDNSQQIVSSTGDDGVATIIQALLLVAFAALTILTVGVIYIGGKDFLEKREREKFEIEEAANRKNGKKKKVVKTKAGPRGFGQKIDDEV